MGSQLTRLKAHIRWLNKGIILLIVFAVLAGVLVVPTATQAQGVVSAILGWAFSTAGGTLFVLLGAILYLPIYFFGLLISLLIWLLVTVASYNGFGGETGVVLGWTIIRDIANMFFIIVLLVIAVATIFKVESYSYRALLPKLIIMAILINFSRTIALFFVDISQVIMLTFVNAFRDIAAGNIVNATGVGNLIGLVDAGKLVFTSDAAGYNLLASLILGIIVLVVTAGILVVFIVVLAFRIIMLWMLMVLSPLAFLLSAFPGGQKYASQWWEKLAGHLIVGPVLAFFLWLTFTIMDRNLYESFAPGLRPEERAIIDSANPFIGNVGNVGSMINFIIIIGLLMGSLTIASQLGVLGGEIAGKVSGGLSKLGAAPFKGMAKLGGVVAKGVGKDIASRLGISDDLLSKEGWQHIKEEITEKGKRRRSQRVHRILQGREKKGSILQAVSRPRYVARHLWELRTLKDLALRGPGHVFGKDYEKKKEEMEHVAELKDKELMKASQGDIGQQLLERIGAEKGIYEQIEKGYKSELQSLDLSKANEEIARRERILSGDEKLGVQGYINRYKKDVEDGKLNLTLDQLEEEAEQMDTMFKSPPAEKGQFANVTKKLKAERDKLEKEDAEQALLPEAQQSAEYKARQERKGELEGWLKMDNTNGPVYQKKTAEEALEDLKRLKDTDPAAFEKRALAYFNQMEANEKGRKELLEKGGLTDHQWENREERLKALTTTGGVIEAARDQAKLARAKLAAGDTTSQAALEAKRLDDIVTALEKERDDLKTLETLRHQLDELPNRLARAIAQGDKGAKEAAKLKKELSDARTQYLGFSDKKYDGGTKTYLADKDEKVENKGFAEAAEKQAKVYAEMVKPENRVTAEQREQARRQAGLYDEQLAAIKKEADKIRPAYDFESRLHIRQDIDEEERKLTTDNWKELVRIAEDAMKENDGVRAAAALRKATRHGNENEFQNWFNYGSSAQGLKQFVMGELVGTTGGLNEKMAKKMGLSWDDYIDEYGIKRQGFKDKKGMGLTSDIAMAIGNDVSYTGEGIGHWGVARAMDADYLTGEPMWAKEMNRNIEILAEIEKGDFESFMRNKNRLALFDEVPYSKDDFRKNGNRAGHILPAGATLVMRNYWKFPEILNRGRIQPSMQKNLANPRTLRTLEYLAPQLKGDMKNFVSVLGQLRDSIRTMPDEGFSDAADYFNRIKAMRRMGI